MFRNNANTGYGNRVQTLDKLLRQTGYEDVAAKLAAQQMSSWMPRGIQGAVASSIPALGAYLTHPFLTGIAAPFSSPRLMGEAAYGIGKGRAMYEKNMSPWLSPAMKEMTLPRAAVTGRLEDEGALPPQQRARGGYLRTRGR